jgi:hypothetical protein
MLTHTLVFEELDGESDDTWYDCGGFYMDARDSS